MNENIELGYAMDPTAVYGPTSSSHLLMGDREEGEQVITDGPLEGAVGPGIEGAPTSRITVRGFLRSPVGLLLILLVASYVVYDRVFGYN